MVVLTSVWPRTRTRRSLSPLPTTVPVILRRRKRTIASSGAFRKVGGSYRGGSIRASCSIEDADATVESGSCRGGVSRTGARGVSVFLVSGEVSGDHGPILSTTPAVTPAGVFYVACDHGTGGPSLHVKEPVSGQDRTLGTLDKFLRESTPIALAVSPNGKTVLYMGADAYGQDLMLIENFR